MFTGRLACGLLVLAVVSRIFSCAVRIGIGGIGKIVSCMFGKFGQKLTNVCSGSIAYLESSSRERSRIVDHSALLLAAAGGWCWFVVRKITAGWLVAGACLV